MRRVGLHRWRLDEQGNTKYVLGLHVIATAGEFIYIASNVNNFLLAILQNRATMVLIVQMICTKAHAQYCHS